MFGSVLTADDDKAPCAKGYPLSINTVPPLAPRSAPSDARSRTEKLAPVLLRTVLQEAQRLGLDTTSMCSGQGFSPDNLDIPGFMVTHFEAATVLRRALLQIGNPSLGLELGMRSNLANRGALALGLLASPTPSDAIRLMLQFPASAGLMLGLHEQTSAQQYALVAVPLFGNHDLEPFLVDKLFTGLVRLCRQGVGGDYAPLVVELMRPPPAEAGEAALYETYFGCPVRFASSRNQLVSEARWMACRLPTANAMAYSYAEAALRCEAAHAAQAGQVGQLAISAVGLAVGRVLRQALPDASSPAELASSLNLSERTLRRRLMDSGLSYRAMQDEGRKSRALTLVLNGQMTLNEIARETGFADLSNFRRAFKRWTGRTPNQMREFSEE